jgi:hypothetical protein
LKTLQNWVAGVAAGREIAHDHAMRIGPTKDEIAVDVVNQERGLPEYRRKGKGGSILGVIDFSSPWPRRFQTV